ncbi:hypothetical protein DWH54_24585 [Escherichia coli]|nr:hypothetical protein [Escherichia coli]
MPVSVVGVNISKTGNYTILITVSKGIVVHGPRDSIFKENTIQQCTCTVSIILAISIKALARALSFSETLHAAFRFSF